MKVLLLAVFLGFAAAGSIQDVKHAVYETVVATQRGTENAGRLYMAVGLPECASQLNAVERDMKTGLGKALQEILHKLTKKYEEVVDNVNATVGKVTEKLSELKEKLQKLAEEGKEKSQKAIDLVRKTVHDIMDTVLDKVQKKKENLDEQMDEVAKLKIQDLIKRLREKILERVDSIRKYMKEIAVDNEAVRQLKALLHSINDQQLGELINNILDLSGHEYRHLKELVEQLKAIGAKSQGVLKEKIGDLVGWVHTVWDDGMKEMVEKFRKVKSTVFELISKTKDFSVEAVRDALKQLESYKEHLGDLYGKLVESLKKAIGKF